MTKIERVERTLSGESVDRPPVSMWYHFGVQHRPGIDFARISLDYFRHYDFDFLKLMNDYYYPMPRGLEEIASAADLSKLERFEPEDSPWREQLSAIEHVAAELSGEAMFIDTIFEPWQSLERTLAGEHLRTLMQREPQALKDALEVVTDNLIAYARAAIERGSSGVFVSVMASEEFLTPEQAREFELPYARRLLEAVSDLAPMNTLHAHGGKIYVDDVSTMPVSVLSYQDRGAANPSLAEMRERFHGCLMGGIDHTDFSPRTPRYVRERTREGIAAGGSTRFFLANGCSIPAEVNPSVIHAVVEEAKAAAGLP